MVYQIFKIKSYSQLHQRGNWIDHKMLSSRTVMIRITEHLRNIRSFTKNISKSLINLDRISEVAVHFNLNGHKLTRDFKFFIFESNVNNSIIRKSIETDLINLFIKFDIKTLNNKKPNLNKIYLTFQS